MGNHAMGKPILFTLCVALLGHAVVFPEPAQQGISQKRHLFVELTDGSCFYGTTSLTKIGVKTEHLAGEVPLERVLKAERDERGGPLVVSMSNGDRMRGTLLLEALPLKSLLGDLTILWKYVQRIESLPDGACSIPRVGLVAYYPADGNAQDASGNGHHGSADPPGWAPDRRGKSPGAFLFNGKRGFINIKHTEKLATDESFALCAWINPTTVTDQAWLVSKHYVAPWSGDYSLRLRKDRRLSFGVVNADGRYVSEGVASGKTVPLKEWTHVAATFHEGELKLYINGELDAEKTSEKVRHTTLKRYPKDHITIGAWSHRPMYFFNGAIDDVAIYSRALSRAEIRAVMNAKPFALPAREESK